MSQAGEIASEYRALPSVDVLLEDLSTLDAPRALVRAWVRAALVEARALLAEAGARTDRGEAAALPASGREAWRAWLAAAVRAMARERSEGMLRRVVNATGVLIHTNLGRAPLSRDALDAVLQAGTGYCSLEMDLGTGRRRSRLAPIRRLLPLLTGAEAGIAVHNTAAAVFLVLASLARGREVIVSRAHLVEIGGSFRLPEIMEAAGVRLVEVGATNRTRIRDYESRIGPDTALLLKVHPSNFRMIGFTEEVPTEELSALAARHGIPFFEDLGSGALRQHGELTFAEPRVQEAIEAGADLVAFSGDKLLGAPQAGILVGRSRWIDVVQKDPVARIVRLDKTALAALERTLESWLRGPEAARSEIPLVAMLAASVEDLACRAEALAARVSSVLGPAWRCSVVESVAEVGGGSLPGQELPSRAVELAGPISVEEIARTLRTGEPPIVGRIEKDRFLLDVRTLLEGDEDDVVCAMEGLK